MNKHVSLSLQPQERVLPARRRLPLTEMERLMALSMLFSCLLVGIRVIHTGRNTFLFLVWNLFLAFVPYLISSRMTMIVKGGGSEGLRRGGALRRRWLLIGAGLGWILCVPNAFYIVTDLFHLSDWYNDHLIPTWFDLVMILSFAWNGLFLGVLSVRQVEKLIQPRLRAGCTMAIVFPFLIMVLNGIGVYIGRYLRFNSWDVMTNPFGLFADIAGMIIHPLRHRNAWEMILCYSILMTLMYLMLKKVSRALT